MIIRIIWLSLACVASVRKEREGNLGERPRTREKGGEERVPLLLPRASFVLLTRPKSSFPSLWNACHSGWIISQTVGKNGMFVLVTLRFLSNLPITSIASLLYFFHVSVVRFNVWLNLSIKDNVLLNTVYKSCPLFALHVVTTKSELSMPVLSLNIDLSNSAICILSYSSAFMEKDLSSSQGFFP